MNYHFLYLFLLFCLQYCPSFAQTSKVTSMYGGLANGSFSTSKEENLLFIDISPNLMVFIEDNLAVGGSVEFGIIRYGVNRYNSLGIFPTARWYFGKPQQPGRLFLLGDFGYHLTSYTFNIDGTAKTGLGLGGGPGFSYFFSPTVAIECLAKGRAIRYSNKSSSLQYQLKVGVQLYLKPQRRY